jgi:hypothetical protein
MRRGGEEVAGIPLDTLSIYRVLNGSFLTVQMSRSQVLRGQVLRSQMSRGQVSRGQVLRVQMLRLQMS